MGPGSSLDRQSLILIHAPIGRDARILHELYQRAGLTSLPCPTIADLCREMEREAGAVVITEEAFDLSTVQALAATLKKQEAWSDLPLLVLTSRGDSSETGRQRLIELEALGDLTFLERPLRSQTLISAARSALRSRAKQCELRQRDAELQLVTDNVPVLISYVDPNEVYRRANRTYLEWFGKHPHEVVGRSMRDILGEDTYKRVRPYFHRALEGERVSFESFLRDRHGRIREISVTYSPELNSEGAVHGVVILVHDVSEQKRSEKALLDRERDLSTLLANLPDVVCRFSPDLRFLYVSPAVRRTTGREPEHFLGKTHGEAGLPPDLVAGIESKLREISATREVGTIEFDLPAPGGEIRSYFAIGVPERGPTGQVESILTILRDHTERKRAEGERERLYAELRETQWRLQAVIAQMPSGLFLVEAPSGRVIANNAEAERILGHPAVPSESYTGYSAYGGVHPDGTPYAPEEYPTAKALLREEVVQQEHMVYRRGDGELVHLSINAAPVKDGGKTIAAVCTFNDVTAQKKLELALQESQNRLAIAMRSAGLGAWEFDLETGANTWDERVPQLLGIPAEEVVEASKSWLDLVHPEDRNRVTEAFRLALTTHDQYDVDFRVLRRDGAERWFGSRGMLLSGSDGTRKMIGVVQDITVRKQAEEALRKSAAEFAQIANSLPQLVWVTRPDGHHEWYNRRWYEYTGATFEESSGTQWARFFHPDDQEEARRRWTQSLLTGNSYEVEYRCRRQDGVWRWFLGRAEPIREESGAITRWFGTCTDIQDQKEAEEELRRSNEDLERFAYMASHDLQEPLRMVTSYSQLLARRYRGKLDTDADEYLRFVLDGTQRMGILIRDLLVYAHSASTESIQTTAVDCNSALQMALANLRGAIEERQPSLSWDSLPCVQAVEGLVAQVLQNLIGNAIKYSRPGTIPEIHIGARRVGSDWAICVRDNGQGIPPQYQQKVFGLFTRLHGSSVSGTGIGLATCKRIVERLGGRIWLESEPEVGSTFYFLLPPGTPAL